jgi:hypothetical protein
MMLIFHTLLDSPGLHCNQSFCDHFASMFEGSDSVFNISQFAQTFLTNPSKNLPMQNSYTVMITETLI